MDKRIARKERSRAALKAAFLELFQTKEPKEISVVDLCAKAGINRSTFYAHYGLMDNLVREIIRESVSEVYNDMGFQWDLPLEDGGVDRSVIRIYLRRFLSNPTLRRFCTCTESGRYRSLIIHAQIEVTLGESPDPTRYYTAYFYNAGVLNFTLEWFNNERTIPNEDAVEIVHEFSKVMYREIP